MTRSLRIFYIALFMLILTALGLWSMRSFFGFSTNPDATVLNGRWAKAVETHYDDEFPIKRLGTNIWAALDYKLFNEGRKGVVLGRDQWLYSDEEFNPIVNEELNLLLFCVHGPLKDPAGFNFPESAMFGEASRLPLLLEDGRVHAGLYFALLALVAVWVLLQKSFVGFQIKVLGLDARAAGFAGFRQKPLVWLALLISGALAGLAGVCEVTGPIGQLVPQVSPGYGYAAITVAFLGRLNPIGILFSSLLMALLYIGGESAQMSLNLPQAITQLFQGMMLFFLLACDVLILYRPRLNLRWARRTRTTAVQAGAL